jgi:alanine racemase
MTSEPGRTLRLRRDADALAANWRTLDAMSGAASAGAAVKADAYGIGVDFAVPVLRDAGCGTFFVAHWSEVANVVAHVPGNRISVLHGPLTGEDCAYARATGARPVINSLYQAKLWLEGGGGPCDLMVDTGINRLGLAPEETGDPLIARLAIDTIMSHLACADEEHPLNAKQLAAAHEIFAALPAKRRSLANSAGIALGADYAFDLTRPGISLYGGSQVPALESAIRQVAFPEAAIIQRHVLKAGDSTGYNAQFTAKSDMEVATISIGYADGFLRCWTGKAVLRHEGAELPVLGRVSMDRVVVDVSAAPQLKEGDWISIPYGLPKASAVSGLSQYELLTGLGRRFAH